MGKEERAGLKVLAHALVGLAATLDCTLETFSLGPAARVCGMPPALQAPRLRSTLQAHVSIITAGRLFILSRAIATPPAES